MQHFHLHIWCITVHHLSEVQYLSYKYMAPCPLFFNHATTTKSRSHCWCCCDFGDVHTQNIQCLWKRANSAVNLKGIWPRRASTARAVHAAGVGVHGGGIPVKSTDFGGSLPICLPSYRQPTDLPQSTDFYRFFRGSTEFKFFLPIPRWSTAPSKSCRSWVNSFWIKALN